MRDRSAESEAPSATMSDVARVGRGSDGGVARILALQRSIGNQAVNALLGSPILQRACRDGQATPDQAETAPVSDTIFSVALRAAAGGYSGVTFTITTEDCGARLAYRMHGDGGGRGGAASSLVDDLRAVLRWSFGEAGVFEIVLSRDDRGDLAFSSWEPLRRFGPPVGVARSGQGENVVVVMGSPSPDQAQKLQFVTAGLREHGHTVWFVERTGYELAGVALSEITSRAPGGRVRWVTPDDPLVDQLNRLPPGSVRRLVVYSHGLQGLVTLRYGWSGHPNYGLSRDDARHVDGHILAPGGVVDLESCQGGTNLDGGSLAQVLADTTGHDVAGWTGRTSYADVNAGRGGVRGSEYGLNWDAVREFGVRNFVAHDTPHRALFSPRLARQARADDEATRALQRVSRAVTAQLARAPTPTPTNDDIARQFGATDFAALRASLQARTEHVLGHDVTGLQPEFAARIRGAEQALATSANGGAPITDAQWRSIFNVRSVGGGRWTAAGGPAGMHGWGLAIDVNYEGAPFVMHEHGEAVLDAQLGPIYDRIAWLMLGHGSVIPQAMTQSPARGDTVTRQWVASLTDESSAMQQYFTLMNDPAASGWAAAFTAARAQWSHLGLAGAVPTADAELQVALRAQMAADYGVLGGHPGTTGSDSLPVPRPAALPAGVDRPFKGRDPATGYFNLNADLVSALRAQPQMRWGAIDFGHESGDIMHFDIQPFFQAKKAAATRALATATPSAGGAGAAPTTPTPSAATAGGAAPVSDASDVIAPADACQAFT